MGEGAALHHVGCRTKALNLLPFIPASAVFDPEAQTRRELVAGSCKGRRYFLDLRRKFSE